MTLATGGEVHLAPRRLPPPNSRGPACAAVVGAVLTIAVSGGLLAAGKISGSHSWLLTAVAVATVAAALMGGGLAATALRADRRSRRALDGEDLPTARALAADSRDRSWRALSIEFASLLVVALLFVVSANHAAIQETFLQWHFMRDATGDTLRAFQTNVVIAVGAWPIVMVFALLLAVMRLLPGPQARPVRALAVAYVDLFRALPVIIVVYLVGFGLPLTGLPVISTLSATWYAIIALSLSYSAYVAETYRAGVQSVHPAQLAAARSLGLSYARALRYVVLPQAVRAVVGPLLTYFVALQKDTALIGIVGTVDAFQQARLYSSDQFNLSSVVLVSIIFVALTIPQTRLVDWLLARGSRRRGRLA